MKGIPRTIYHGQPENCSGDFGAIQDGLFHRDLVIVLVHPTKDALHHFHSLWRVELTISSGGESSVSGNASRGPGSLWCTTPHARYTSMLLIAITRRATLREVL